MKVKCDSINHYEEKVVVTFLGTVGTEDSPVVMNDEVGFKLQYDMKTWDGQYKPGCTYNMALG